MTSYKFATTLKMLKDCSLTLFSSQMKVKTCYQLNKTGYKPKKPKISYKLMIISHKARKENQFLMSFMKLVKLLKLMEFLVRKMVIIMPTLITNNLLKLVIMLNKLGITSMLSKDQIKPKPYHIYLRNHLKPLRVNNSKDMVVTSLSQSKFKLLGGMLNTLSTPL